MYVHWMQGHRTFCRLWHAAPVAALVGTLTACPAPATVKQDTGGGARPRDATALDGLYRGGRLAELASRLSSGEVQADPRSTGLSGLLLVLLGHMKEGSDLLTQAASMPGEGRCLRLELALADFYQLGDAAAAAKALELPAGADCSSEGAARTENALRARLGSLARGPVFQVDGPPGEHMLPMDRIAASAGYLVVRVIFDREHSGQFLLGSGTPEMVIDGELARSLHLAEQTEHPMPVEMVPGLAGVSAMAGQVLALPTATVPQARIGLFTARNVPVLVGDFRELRDRFRRLVSRDVTIDGVLPIQRLFPGGYVRLQQRATDLRVALDGSAMGPCRLQHPFSTKLYQIAGALFVDGALSGSPPLLMRLGIGQRRTVVRHSMLPYASVKPAREGGEADVARPPITEAEVTQRLKDLVLQLGQAQLNLHHVPLAESHASPLLRPEVHGLVGMDVPGEFDIMIDIGLGRFYLAPPGQVHC